MIVRQIKALAFAKIFLNFLLYALLESIFSIFVVLSDITVP